jgi:hypothetical protein
MLHAQHDPPTHKHFLHILNLGCVGEYFRTTNVLAPFSPTPTSSNTTMSFTTLHFELGNFFPFFLEDYKPNQNLELSFDFFKLTFQHMLTRPPVPC